PGAGTSQRTSHALAPPLPSAGSVAMATISACDHYASLDLRLSRSPSRLGRDLPETSPSFEDRYWTSTAMRFAATRTHTSRYPYSAPAVRLAATLPGST